MPSTDWGRLDNQPPMSAPIMKSYINNYTNQLVNSMQSDMNMIAGGKQKEQISQIAYCLKCKKKQPIKNPKQKKTANNRVMLQGNCNSCNSRVSSF